MKKIVPLILSTFFIGILSHRGLAQDLIAKNENTETSSAGHSNGDNIAMTGLTVKEIVTNNIIASICTGDTYFFGMQAITTAGVYTQTFPSANKGDSIVTLHLTVNPNVTSTVSLTLHSNQLPATWNGITIPAGTTSNSTFTTYSTFNTIGCDSTVTLNLTVNQSLKAGACCTLMMPNAFSPNGDGMNDKFGPDTNCHPSRYLMRIYNHSGQMIYVAHEVEQKWDGTCNGQPVDLGTYRYVITGDCENGEPIRMKGEIILIR
jgi:gliding motility-associated-like protein